MALFKATGFEVGTWDMEAAGFGWTVEGGDLAPEITDEWSHQYFAPGDPINPIGGSAKSVKFVGTDTTYCSIVLDNLPSPKTFSFAFKLTGPSSATEGLLIFLTLAGAIQASLFIRADGKLELFRGETTSLLVSTGSIDLTKPHWISAYANPQNFAGDILVYVDDGPLGKIDFTGDCQELASPGWDGIKIGCTYMPDYELFIDCFFLGNNSADYVSESYICLLQPNADGDAADWMTSSGSTMYSKVRENPPDTIDYIETTTVGSKYLLQFPNLQVSPDSILFVMPTTYSEGDGSITNIEHIVKSQGVEIVGAPKAVGGIGAPTLQTTIMSTDEIGGSWTEPKVNSIQSGGQSA